MNWNKELVHLIGENPELEVIIHVDCNVLSMYDNEFSAIGRGAIKSARLIECCDGLSDFLVKGDTEIWTAVESFYGSDYLDEHPNFSDEDLYAVIPWKKAILVDVY